MRYPLPWSLPANRREFRVGRGGALGDVLMCTPALRELKRINPKCRIVFFTKYPQLISGLPFIDQVIEIGDDSPQRITWLQYESGSAPRRHIARKIGDWVGLKVADVRPSCVIRSDLIDRFKENWRGLAHPWIVVNRKPGGWTPNKDWPDQYWSALICDLAKSATLIEIGCSAAEPTESGITVDLRGKTNIPELAAVIAAADMHVGPVSGPVHIAAAARTPSVVIYGGYEHPDGSGYPGNINLYTPLRCAPCWLRTPCPFNRQCLHQILPQQVHAAIKRLWIEANSSKTTECGDAMPAFEDLGVCKGAR
jgi:ADP-heptose:LPS heptosyltransferase